MYFMNSFSTLRRVPTPLLMVCGLHLVVVWALFNALRFHDTPPAAAPPLSIDFIDKPTPPVEPVHIDLTLKDLTIDVPEPEAVPVPPEDPVAAPPSDAEPQSSGEAFRTPVTAASPTLTGAAVDPSRPLTQPPYPPASIRNNEAGTVAIDVLVGTDGRVQEAKVARSSGSARLDQAAMAEARQHWRLRPATRDGVPFEQWLTLRVVFRLENR